MIEIDIPGFGRLQFERLILDYNGTIAVDGQPVKGVNSSCATHRNTRPDSRHIWRSQKKALRYSMQDTCLTG